MFTENVFAMIYPNAIANATAEPPLSKSVASDVAAVPKPSVVRAAAASASSISVPPNVDTALLSSLSCSDL